MAKRVKKRPSSNKSAKAANGKVKGPLNPYLVLAIAIILPGAGQVLNNTPTRGLLMIFFMLVGAWICFNTTTPEHSFLGRYAGGWFVYAISILDAYRFARVRHEISRYHNPESADKAG